MFQTAVTSQRNSDAGFRIIVISCYFVLCLIIVISHYFVDGFETWQSVYMSRMSMRVMTCMPHYRRDSCYLMFIYYIKFYILIVLSKPSEKICILLTQKSHIQYSGLISCRIIAYLCDDLRKSLHINLQYHSFGQLLTFEVGENYCITYVLLIK